MAERAPYQIIEAMVQARAALDDDEVLAQIGALEPLPDEDDASLSHDGSLAWERVYLFVALADVAALRRLRPAAALLLARAAYGDPGETMRGLRHSLEAIFARDEDALRDVCVAALASPRPGTRLWSVFELGTLRDPSTLAVVRALLDDPAALVRASAATAVAMIMK